MAIKDSKYVKTNSVNPLYLITNKVNGYFEEIKKNKYLILVSTNDGKEKMNKFEELWVKIIDFIRSITKNLDDYDKKEIKIKFNSDDELSLNKMIETHSIILVVWAVLHENSK